MRFFLALATLSLAGCAAAAAGGSTVPPNAAPTTQIHKMGTGIDVTPANDVVVVPTDLPVPPPRAWAALGQAYAAYGIPTPEQSAATYTLGNANYHPPRMLLGQRLSTYLDCGNTGMSGAPGADVYTVRMAIRSQLVPTPAGSRVETSVTAAARNMDGSGSADVHCVSTGRLENALAALVLTHLAS
jgi:hypothetical protein